MNSTRIVNAIGYLEDDLIAEASAPKSLRFSSNPVCRSSFFKACACFTLLSCLFIFLFCQKQVNSQFSSLELTAYAQSPTDGSLLTAELTVGKEIPISMFETESGIKGFVFSRKKASSASPSSIVIVSGGQMSESEEIEAISDQINGLDKEHTRDYFFYIPSRDETAPFSFSLFFPSDQSEVTYQCDISIERNNGEYYAKLSLVRVFTQCSN